MHWYYSIKEERQGPVTAGDLAALLTKGTVNGQTLVWRDGLPDWVPLSTVTAELGAVPPSLASATLPGAVLPGKSQRCDECGFLFPSAEILALNGIHVCARCKPVFIQKLKEGVPFGGAHGVWRRKREMVVALEATLPDRCVKCNADTSGKRLKRQLFWHHPLLYIMIIFPGLLIYALVAVCVRKKATLQVGICDTHKSQRRWAIFTSWAGMLLAIAAMIGGAAILPTDMAPITLLLGIVLFIASAIYGVVRSRVVYPKKIDTQHAYVGGACPAFLDQLPEWPNLK
jgi:hypothetical protein